VTSKGTGKAPKGYRKPSYGAAGRHARIVYELLDRPHGWSFEAIQNELQISERTIFRYVAALREQLVDSEGRLRMLYPSSVRSPRRRTLRPL